MKTACLSVIDAQREMDERNEGSLPVLVVAFASESKEGAHWVGPGAEHKDERRRVRHVLEERRQVRVWRLDKQRTKVLLHKVRHGKHHLDTHGKHELDTHSKHQLDTRSKHQLETHSKHQLDTHSIH